MEDLTGEGTVKQLIAEAGFSLRKQDYELSFDAASISAT